MLYGTDNILRGIPGYSPYLAWTTPICDATIRSYALRYIVSPQELSLY